MIVAVAVVGTLLVSVVAADATPVVASAAPPQHWSYSYQKWDNRTSGNNSTAVSYTVAAYYSFQDQITATNTSATTVEMMGVQSVLETLDVLGCAPSCTGPHVPMYTYNLSVVGTSSKTQYLNFTTNASVSETTGTANTTRAPALGITNASSSGQQQLTERSTTTLGNRTIVRTLNETAASHAAVAFTPALGLIPWNLTKNLTWSSRSAFVASGGWTSSFVATLSSKGYTSTHSGNDSGTVNRTGNESVRGKYFAAGPTPRGGNRTVSWIGLRYRGPFDFDNSLFMTAIGSDLFAGATANWTVGARPAYGNVSPVVGTVITEHAAPAPGSGTGTPAPGSGSGTSPVTNPAPNPVTNPVTSPGTGPVTSPSPGTGTSPAPVVGSPGSGTAPTSNAPTVSAPTPLSGHAITFGSLLLPIGALALVGIGAAVVFAARRGSRGRARP